MNYQITEDIRLRGSYTKGIRAPDVKELFGGNFQSFIPTNNGDPCDTALGAYAGSPTCVAALKKVGINPATYVSLINQAAAQTPVTEGGNPGLKPETSHSVSVGAVFTPRVVPHLSVSTDYYSIHIQNAILDGGFGGTYLDNLLAQCYGPAQSAAVARHHPHADLGRYLQRSVAERQFRLRTRPGHRH